MKTRIYAAPAVKGLRKNKLTNPGTSLYLLKKYILTKAQISTPESFRGWLVTG